jgi:WD40 repeat protein
MPLLAATVMAATASHASPNVAALTEGMVKAMFYKKLQCAVILLLALALGGTGLALLHPVLPRADAGGAVVQLAPQERPRHDAEAAAKVGEDMSRPIRSLNGHQDRVMSVAYSPDGRWIATAAWDGTARVWDAQTGQEVRRLDVPATANYKSAHLSQILFSPDSQFVVIAQQCAPNEPGVIVWNRHTGERVRELPGECVALSPDGKQIACGGWGSLDSNYAGIQLYEFATGKLVRELHTPYSRIDQLTFSLDGQSLVAQVRIPRPPLKNGMQRLGRDGAQVRAWNLATGKERESGLAGSWNEHHIALSPDGRTLALDGSLREIATGGQRAVLTGHTSDVWAVAFSPDGRVLASGSMDGTVRLWDPASGKELARLGEEVPRFAGRGWVLAVAFSPDGRTLVCGGLDKIVHLWDVSRITARRREIAERSPAELDADWKELAGDVVPGYAALGRLIASPGRSVAFLGKQLQSTPTVDTKQIERLIAALDDKQFPVRAQATKDLEALAERAGPALRKALVGSPPLETRRRLEALLERLDGVRLSAETVRQIRAIEALEYIGNPPARRLLEELAAGPAEMLLTLEAKGAAEHLAKRASVAP